MSRFILMVQFFTRIPINKNVSVENKDFKIGSIYLPIVGLIIGCICSAFYMLSFLTGNSFFASVIAVLAGVMVTGGLHVDGLADTCDAFFSSRSKEKMLEIMKDSRIGTMGSLAIVFLILIKVSIVWGMDYKAAAYSLAIASVVSRTSLLYSIVIAKYPKEKGLGRTFIGNVTYKEFFIGMVICSIMVFPVLKIYLFAPIALIVVLPYIFNKYVESKIGGMTGDTLGALCEISEVMCLTLLYTLSNYIWR